MSGKPNNRVLLIILAALLGIFVLVRVFRTSKREKTLRTELIHVDTSRISRIRLYPGAEDHEEILFRKNPEGSWRVRHGDVDAEADPRSVKSMLTEILNIKPERLAATSRDKFAEFQLTDSLATRIVVEEGKKETLDLLVGKFSYKPSPGPSYGGYSNRYGRGISYIRLHDEEHIYAVDGFLTMSFNQGFNAWRNQVVTDLNRQDLTAFRFDYPADSGFVVRQRDSVWYIGSVRPDSASMIQYLNTISHRSGSSFADDLKPSGNPDFQLTIEGRNMRPVNLKGYLKDEEEIIIHSSQNPEAWFKSKKTGLFDDLFKGKGYFTQSN